MIHIQKFTFNPFQENTYILYNDKKEAILIDPGMYDIGEQNIFFNYIEKNQMQPVMLLNTHTHLDHIFGIEAVLKKFDIQYGFHNEDTPVFNAAVSAAIYYHVDLKKPRNPDFYIEENKPLLLGEDRIDVLFTPGHSPGSVSFYIAHQHQIIVGDVLFQMSIGRTDLPGGHHETLIQSIHTQLMPLPPQTIVYSGHGPETTIGLEKMNNPFLS